MVAKEKQEYTKYEIARILGARALQISMNAPILLKIEKSKLEEINYDPLKIAKMEFDNDALPITVRRPLPKRVEHVETVREEIEEIAAVVEEKPKEKKKEEAEEEGEKEEVKEEKPKEKKKGKEEKKEVEKKEEPEEKEEVEEEIKKEAQEEKAELSEDEKEELEEFGEEAEAPEEKGIGSEE